MGFGKRLLGWFGVILALALAIAIGYMMERFPPNKVGNCSHNDHKFKSKVGLPWSISQDNNVGSFPAAPAAVSPLLRHNWHIAYSSSWLCVHQGWVSLRYLEEGSSQR